MKALSMPVSSPSRAEKFPPPLMRFLKSNVGSRSRGRSRASPMFYTRSKKNAAGVNIETTQEPSSPKVTCIGQVRVRRSAKSKPKSAARTGHLTSNRRPWWWLKKPLFCTRIFPRLGGQRAFCGPFLRWALFFRSGYCNKVDAREDSFRVHSNQKCQTDENCVAGGNNSNSSSSSDGEVDGGIKYENLETGIPRNKKDLIISPPKNALILTRCRSAPYRSSSLAGRIWGTQFESSETEGVKTENESKPEQESQEPQNPTSENMVEESRTSPEISKELENTEKNVEELQGIAGGAIHPLLLTRSKSEPARTGERLNPECRPTRMANFEESNPLLPKEEQETSDEKKSPVTATNKNGGAPIHAEAVKQSPMSVPIGWTADGLPLSVVGEPMRQRGHWDSGIFACLGRNDEFCSSDLEVCLLGSVAPCVLYGSNVERLGSAPGTFTSHCLPYTGLYLIGNSIFGWNCLAPWLTHPIRTAIRRKFNLEGSCEALARTCGCCRSLVEDEVQREQCETGCDFATHVFCHPCALCQEGREVRRRLHHPGFSTQPVLVMIPPGGQTMGRAA